MKKSYTLFIVIITILLAAGCQPTPEELVVQNKADGELKQAVAVTAAPQTDTPQNTDTPEETIRVTETATNDTGTVTVNIDAPVKMPETLKIPVAQVEPVTLSEERLEQIVTAFYGNATLYAPVSTKADYEASILRMQKRIADDDALLNSDMADASGVTDLEELRRMQNERIEQQKKLMKKAPDERPAIGGFDGALSKSGLFASVDIGMDYMGYVSTHVNDSGQKLECYCFGGEWPQKWRTLEFKKAVSVDVSAGGSGLDIAGEAAQNLIDAAGIEGVTLGRVFKTKDYPGLVSEEFGVLSSNREFYVFCFERVVGETSIAFTFCRGEYSDDNDFQKSTPYERIEVWVEGDQAVQFRWTNPAEITQTINDNVAISVDLERALELMKKQAYIQFVDQLGHFDQQIINIDRIEFELVRLTEKDTGRYITVPAWSFYGDVLDRITQKLADNWNQNGRDCSTGDYVSRSERGYPNDTLITINALDGSIIDMDKGY